VWLSRAVPLCPPYAVCSFANGHAWVLDTDSGSWKGYKLAFTDPKPAKRGHKQKAQQTQHAAADTVHGAPNAAITGAVPQAATSGDKESCPLAVE
jgi:hypothetical protein